MTRRSLLVLSSLGGLLLAAGCGGRPSPAPPAAGENGPAEVLLQLNWKPEPQFGGFYAAETAGAYARHGLRVEIRPGGAGAPTIDMLGAGTVPFAIVSADEIVRARANGNLIVGLFAAYQTNPQGIMTRASRGFASIADVFAQPGTLAMERGLPYSDFLERKYGFERLRIVPSPFGDLSLYRTDESYAMQCFVTAEPLQARRAGIEPQAFLIAEAGYNPYTTVLATSEDWLRANPEPARAMVAAVRAGWRAYLEDPAPANAVMHGLNPTMDEQTFAESAAAQKPLILPADGDPSAVGAMTLERWQTLIDQLVELGVITAAPAAADCFTSLD